jgi:serine protease
MGHHDGLAKYQHRSRGHRFLYNHPDLAGRAIGGYDFIYDFAYANDNQPAQSAGCTAGYPVVNPLAPPCVSSRDSDPSDPGDWIDAADQTANPNSVFWMCPVYPSTWHGSHVAGTIGALSNNANGIAGVNWNSKIVPLRASASAAATFRTLPTRSPGARARRSRVCPPTNIRRGS